VGKGDLESAVIERARNLGVADNVRMIGWSDDIPGIMKSCDAFVFPRLEAPKEGLGLVVVEAQCAGLPLFITDGIVPDAIVLRDRAFFLELRDASGWAACIHEVLVKDGFMERDKCLEIMKLSKFELAHATSNLLAIYEGVPSVEPVNLQA
jgi:glycosyltransferase involved in cell wall biosynthesis